MPMFKINSWRRIRKITNANIRSLYVAFPEDVADGFKKRFEEGTLTSVIWDVMEEKWILRCRGEVCGKVS